MKRRTSEATQQEELVVTVPLSAWREYLERRHARASGMEARADMSGNTERTREWMDRRLALAAVIRNDVIPLEEEGRQEVQIDLNVLLDQVELDDLLSFASSG